MEVAIYDTVCSANCRDKTTELDFLCGGVKRLLQAVHLTTDYPRHNSQWCSGLCLLLMYWSNLERFKKYWIRPQIKAKTK